MSFEVHISPDNYSETYRRCVMHVNNQTSGFLTSVYCTRVDYNFP